MTQLGVMRVLLCVRVKVCVFAGICVRAVSSAVIVGFLVLHFSAFSEF